MKEYRTDELIVSWMPEKCQHAGICARTLPQVFKPKERPWIDLTQADTELLIQTIAKCPSGALTCRLRTNKETGKNAPV
ncbi:(4Fe-4S)-binding protein [Bacteroides sp. Marseille-P3684]|uniref:(4Fe-4S)-binding protein n=1 Tax=Bacteroides sp. Marseille-P3684 TaxID=2086579 RepID=UPI000D0BDE95|nr:(4Fe-4S)-binding protein [Bacteroides sp. Marseille-P3684]